MIVLYTYGVLVLLTMIAVAVVAKRTKNGEKTMEELVLMAGFIIIASICWPAFWLVVIIGRYINGK